MKKPRYGPLILAIIIFLALLFTPASVQHALISNKKVNQAATSLDPNMFQGIALQQKMMDDKKYLPIFGSSELLRLDPYHPSNYFKVNYDGFTPFLVGRGGMQSLVHFLNFASMSNELKDRKFVFILSPQWFNEKGLDSMHFDPNFSKLQAYDFVFNKDIDPTLKKDAAKRLLQFGFIRKDKNLAYLLRGIAYHDKVNSLKLGYEKALGQFNYRVLIWRDTFKSLSVKPHRPNVDPSLKHLSWKELQHRADLMGENDTKTNPYGINDHYYRKKIQAKIGHLKGFRKHENYYHSPEYGDLQLVLDLLKEKHAKALFISVPENGRWYDFAGVPKKTRQYYYTRIKKQVEDAGFPVADFSNHEYDKYFLKDTMHLGWKGWVYVDQAIKKFYNSPNGKI
ncbi:D-alanine transfer protein [Scopulibacillus daqui]|uniref:Protein DltD n=1 Tax=Scopulibacillus daqui TaxID=1469162 RepID=A0ABS2PXU1_9BACL|nr:D-alanyl-lipoteichoic acid biosynthesis protein DltD [Scopulibacillus daqui]MBM7644847.1 D-alanine transfer protein [Scopulibacillus daqui]